MKKEKKPINFVVEKFMLQGVHFFAGHPKAGKSWLALWIAICVSNGNDLWGFKTNKSKVLYFCLEDTENRIQDRLEGMPGCDTDNLLFMYDAPNMDNGFDVFLKKIVKEEPEIKLVIVDTFQLIRGEQFAGNAYACEYAEMNYLKKLAKELHMSKRRVAYLLQNGYIPCVIPDSATWKYTIRTKDVADFIKSEISPDIPSEVLRKKPKIEVMSLKFGKKILEQLFIKRTRKYPDALTYDDISKITGLARKFVYK